MDELQKQIMELVRKADQPDPVHYVDYAVEELAMEKLNDFIVSCDYCEECSRGTKSLVGGNPHGAIMIIGENVLDTQIDKKTIMPFDGTVEGNMLHHLLDEFHVNKEQLLWMNVVNCFTCMSVNGKKLKRAPKTAEIDNCKLYLDYAIDAFKPLYIIVLGNIAFNVFRKGVVAKERGEWFMIRDNIPAMATYSPTTLFQLEDAKADFIEEYKEDFRSDIKKVFLDAQEMFPDSDILLEKLEK